MNRFSKIFFTAGISLLIYGYLCRAMNIYFFWDSKIFGWIALFIALAGFLFGLHKSRKLQGKKTIWVKIALFILLFALIILPIAIFKFKQSEAYQTAIEYLKTDAQIKNSIGDIKGFGLIPTGQSQSISINGATSGDAIFTITVMGNKRFKDIIVTLKKTPETSWTVISSK
jgi:hypothetical protein